MPGEAAGGRIVDGAFASRRAGDQPAADPVAHPPGSRRLGCEGTGFGDLCHGTILRDVRRRSGGRGSMTSDHDTFPGATVPLDAPAVRTAAGPPGPPSAPPPLVALAPAARAERREPGEADCRDEDHQDRDQAAGVQAECHGLVPPGAGDDGPQQAPRPKPEEEGAAVAAARRRPPSGPGSGRPGRSASRSPRRPATAAKAGPGASDPHGPGPE